MANWALGFCSHRRFTPYPFPFKNSYKEMMSLNVSVLRKELEEFALHRVWPAHAMAERPDGFVDPSEESTDGLDRQDKNPSKAEKAERAAAAAVKSMKDGERRRRGPRLGARGSPWTVLTLDEELDALLNDDTD